MGTLIGLLIAGLVVGVLGRLLAAGRSPVSWWFPLLLGVVGALVGGWVAGVIGAGIVIKFALGIAVAAVLVTVLGQGRGRQMVWLRSPRE